MYTVVWLCLPSLSLSMNEEMRMREACANARGRHNDDRKQIIITPSIPFATIIAPVYHSYGTTKIRRRTTTTTSISRIAVCLFLLAEVEAEASSKLASKLASTQAKRGKHHQNARGVF